MTYRIKSVKVKAFEFLVRKAMASKYAKDGRYEELMDKARIFLPQEFELITEKDKFIPKVKSLHTEKIYSYDDWWKDTFEE